MMHFAHIELCMWIPNATTCTLSTSLYMCTYSHITSCSFYQYKTFYTNWNIICSKCNYLFIIKVITFFLTKVLIPKPIFFYIMFTINITTYVYPFTYNNLFLLQIQHILHPMKRECFLEPSLWWNLKCHNFSLCQNMSFTCDMIFFYYEKIFNVTILICVMTQVSHVTWNVCTHWSEGFLEDLHYDESLNVTSLTCVMTWISHMTWICFPLLWQGLEHHSFSLCYDTSFTCDMSFLHPWKWWFFWGTFIVMKG
jgi:hypothetical protein